MRSGDVIRHGQVDEIQGGNQTQAIYDLQLLQQGGVDEFQKAVNNYPVNTTTSN